MLSESGFQGSLSGYSLKTAKDQEQAPWVKLAVKHTAEGEVQTFLDSLEKAFAVHNFKNLFNTTVQWDKMVFAHLHFDVTVQFDTQTFDATLTSLSVARKTTGGVDSFTYSMVFEKDRSTDNLDDVLILNYLKRKHKNEDDKSVLTLFNVKISKAEEKEDDEVLN